MRFIKVFKHVLIVKCFVLCAAISFAQESEADLKIKAEKSYRSENYVEASKFYSQLLAFNKTDALYNYRYGVCLIYNSRKKQDAIKHLIFASKEASVDPEVYFYLGKAYHLNFEFGEAIQYYNLYKTKVGNKINFALDVNRQIEMSENGKRLLSSLNEMVVLEKVEIEATRFFDIYDLKNIGGDIIVNAQFQSKIDKKKNHTPIIHFPANPTTIYYSSYGDDESKGKDIYIRKRLPDGSWSLPQTLTGDVNTKFDEDFPYMHPNGRDLYFCSKGHNSMGGFDVFRSKFNKETNTFEKAENLDFAISSTDDDLFYVVDSLDKNAYFASGRQSLDGKIHVYKVRVDQVPIQIAVIKAAFNSTINAANKKVTVDVFDFANNTKVGTFNSTEKGNVLLTFPKGGKYEYQIKVDGVATIFKSTLNVPFQEEFKPLKQKIVHEMLDGTETVRVVNLFDETVEDPQATMVEIARIRSELNPNASQFDLKALDEKTNNKDVYAKIGYDKLSDREVKENINQLAVLQENQSKNLQEIKQKAIDKIISNVSEIATLQNELKKSSAEADKAEGSDKKELISRAASIVNELNRLEAESKSLIPFADSLTNVIVKSESEAKKARTLVNQINEAFDKNDLILASQLISDNLNAILDLKNDKSDLASEGILKEVLEKKEDLKKIAAGQKEFLDMKVRSKNELIDLDVKLNEAKSKDKPAIQKKIDDKQNEIKYADEELAGIETKLTKKREELAVKEQKLAYIQDVQNSKIPLSNTSLDQAKEKLTASSNQNTTTLKKYVEEQAKSVGLDMASLTFERKSSAGSVVKMSRKEYSSKHKEIANSVSPDFFKTLESIKNDKDLSEEQKLKLSQKEEKSLKFLVSKEIAKTEEALALTPNDAALKTRMAELKSFNDNISNNIAAIQSDLESKFPETNKKKMLSDMQLANRVKPNHFAQMMIIEDDKELTENQKLDQAQKEDQEFIRLLSLEKNKIKDKLSKTPQDEDLLHELKLVDELLAETDKRIEKRTMGMASFNISETKTPDDYVIKNQNSSTNDNKTGDNKTADSKTIDSKTNGNNATNSVVKTNETNTAEAKTQKEKEDELKRLGVNVDNKTGENKTIDSKTNGNNSTNSEVKTNETNTADAKTQKEKEEELKRLGINVDNKTGDNKTIDSKINGNNATNSEVKTNETSTADAKTQKEKEEELKRLGVNVDNKTIDSKTNGNNATNSEVKTNETNSAEAKTQKEKEDELKRLGINVDNKTGDSKTIDSKTNVNNTTNSEVKTNETNGTSASTISSNEFGEIKKVNPSFEKNVNGIKNNPASSPKEKQEKLILEENKLQNSLALKVKEVEKELLKNPSDTSKVREKQTFITLKENSENRENESKQLVISEIKKEINKENLLAASDKNFIKEQKSIESNTSLSPEDKKTQLLALEEKLQTSLTQKSVANEKKIALKEDLKLLAENKVLAELVEESKNRTETLKNPDLVAKTNAVDSKEVKSNSSSNPDKTSVNTGKSANEIGISNLESKEKELKAQLANESLSKTEKSKLTAELAKNQEEQIVIKDKVAETQLAVLEKNGVKLSKSTQVFDKNNAIKDSLSYALIVQNEQKINELQKELAKAKKESKKAELIAEISTLQEENSKSFETLIYSNQLSSDLPKLQEIDSKASQLSLESKAGLQKRKFSVTAEIDEMKQELETLKQAQKLEKDTEKKVIIIKKIDNKEKQLAILKKQLSALDLELKSRSDLENALIVATKESSATYSEEEKVNLSKIENYAVLKDAFVAQKDLAQKKSDLFKELENSKTAYSAAVAEMTKNPSEENKLKVGSAFAELTQKTKQYNELSQKHQEASIAYQKIASGQADIAKLEKLFQEGVESNYIASKTSSNPSNSGNVGKNNSTLVPFEILVVPQTESLSERVILDAEMPSGLVYRVQVGAFRKPVKANLYTEFKPVTGELIKKGITRYITGYFNGILSASEAKKAIRSLGYKDAFIVAYCDGKRITLSQARKLEANGTCVPNGTDEFSNSNALVSNTNKEKTLTNDKNPVIKKEIEVKVNNSTAEKKNAVSDYNVGPGAVKAIAVETKLGLFFTVQIGAYKKPATEKQLKFTENVVSKLLADGMIRYSTGIFPSVAACKDTKNRVIASGINDAFITAYYKGERITLAEAEKLLQEKGESILEKP